MSTDNINQMLDEYFQNALQWILTEMSRIDEPTPKHLIDQFELVCLDDNRDRQALRQERLRRYHDSDRVHQLERLKKISQNIPEELRVVFINRMNTKSVANLGDTEHSQI